MGARLAAQRPRALDDNHDACAANTTTTTNNASADLRKLAPFRLLATLDLVGARASPRCAHDHNRDHAQSITVDTKGTLRPQYEHVPHLRMDSARSALEWDCEYRDDSSPATVHPFDGARITALRLDKGVKMVTKKRQHNTDETQTE